MMLILQLKPFKHFVYREVCNISYGGGEKKKQGIHPKSKEPRVSVFPLLIKISKGISSCAFFFSLFFANM